MTRADIIRERTWAAMKGTLVHDLDEDCTCRVCGAQVYFPEGVGSPLWMPPCRAGGTPMSINDACVHKTQWPVFACDLCMYAYRTGEWPSEEDAHALRAAETICYTKGL